MFGKVEPCQRKVGIAHRIVQERLCKMGKELGFGVIPEYFAPQLLGAQRDSYIDVVWISEAQIAVAFEVHVRKNERCLFQPTGKKDIEKLMKLRAVEKFIVNFSPVTAEVFFHRI